MGSTSWSAPTSISWTFDGGPLARPGFIDINHQRDAIAHPGGELNLFLRLELGRQGAEPHRLFGERPQLRHQGRKDEEGVQPKKGRQTNLDLEPWRSLSSSTSTMRSTTRRSPTLRNKERVRIHAGTHHRQRPGREEVGRVGERETDKPGKKRCTPGRRETACSVRHRRLPSPGRAQRRPPPRQRGFGRSVIPTKIS